MKITKWIACSLAVLIMVAFAGQSAAHAAQGVEDYWPVNSTAKGDRSFGQLTIYYEVDYNADTDCVDQFGEFEPSAYMVFLLRLYKKSSKTWHIITARTELTYCLTVDLIRGDPPGNQQAALLAFLNGPVLDALNTDGDIYTTVHLRDVTDDYENIYPVYPENEPYCVSAEITIVAVE